MNERALLILTAALNLYPERPYDKDWPNNKKEEIIFSKWAINEILELVWDHPWTLASETIRDFELRCLLYVTTSVTDDQKRIFSIAAQTASNILKKIEEVEK